MSKFPYKGTPRPHQIRALKKAWPMRAFAYFHSMRSGKTYTTINLAAARFRAGQIKGLLVVCPTPIKKVWLRELDKWSPCEIDGIFIESGMGKMNIARFMAKQSPDRLKVMVVGVEALSQGSAFGYAKDFVDSMPAMMVIDESSKIKNHSSSRTEKCFDLGGRSEYRLVLTGTPITQGLHDLYSQMMFLDQSIIGCKSYFQFRNRYCIMGGFENRSILGYQFEHDLLDKVRPYVDVVTKEEAMPHLLENDYLDLEVEPTKQQLDAIRQLKDLMEAEQDGKTITVSTVMERLTRYQQVLGGHFPFEDEDGAYQAEPIKGKNPKLEALLDYIEPIDVDTKVIIWARFRPELELIASRLRDAYGVGSVAEFHGGLDDNERQRQADEFQNGNRRFIVSNPQCGGMGQEWSAADVAIYYSNEFSYENRKQSEERTIHADKRKSIMYVDIISNHTADKMITKALAKKQSMAEFVEGNLSEFEL